MSTVIVGLDRRPHDSDAVALAQLLNAALGGTLLFAHIPGRESAPVGLSRLAQSWSAEILVLGSSHRGPVGRIVPGGVASRVLTSPPCTIAVAPLGYSNSPPAAVRAVAVAYDTTRAAEIALREASAGALRLGVPLILYHATYPVPADPAWDEFRGHIRSFAQAIVDSGLRSVPPDVEASGRVLEGHVAEVVAEAASHDDVGLLYVGSRGYGPLREALVGGVAGGLLQQSRVPLVIVPSRPPHPEAEGHSGSGADASSPV
jgi:nucleotide-binding universal stress UspA family protein